MQETSVIEIEAVACGANGIELDRIVTDHLDKVFMPANFDRLDRPVFQLINSAFILCSPHNDFVHNNEARGKTSPRAPHCHLRRLPSFLDVDPPESRKVEAIQVHHLVPGRHKVMDKLLRRVRCSIDLGQGA